MKPIVCLPAIILTAVGIGLYQHFRLTEMKDDTAQLVGADLPRSPGDRSASNTPPNKILIAPAKIITAESQEKIEAILIHAFEMMSKARMGKPLDHAGQSEAEAAQKLLLSTFTGMDAQTAFDLIQRLKISNSLPPDLREHSAEFFVQIMMQTSPEGALGLLQMLTEYPYRESTIKQGFERWAATEPDKALRWFETESKKANSITQDPEMIKSAIVIQARLNPARALSHEQFKTLIADSGTSERLGASIAASFHNSSEHQAFLGALRHEQAKNPGSADLAKIRLEYIEELSNRLDEWTFEEATRLIDSELSPSEKLIAIQGVSHRMDLVDPELWADWFGKIEASSVNESPQYGFVLGWMRSDSVAAGKWLAQAPPAEMKNSLDFEYAFMLSNQDPAKGMEWAMRIPEGSIRAKAIPRLIKDWKAKDPSAAAAFAKEHDLPE